MGFADLTTRLRRDLTHSLSYARGFRTGFDTSYELYDTFGYRITWRGDAAAASGYTTYNRVEPSSDLSSPYTDWVSGVDVSFLLTRWITAFAMTSYTLRHNLDVSALTTEEERRYDYATWVSRIGTSFALTRSIDFVTYYEHTRRSSDASTLQYVWDIFEAYLVYHHQF